MLFDKTKNYEDITLALAGIFQAILLIKDIAKTGKTDEAAFLASINTIYKITAESTETVYEGYANVHMGLKGIINFFNHRKKDQDSEIARYLVSLMYLEKKLSRNKKMRNEISQCIKRASHQIRFFPATHPTVLANLSDAYSQTLGLLSYRISIMGRTSYLKRQDLMNKIRALLLAGIRSTVLWRQVGGNRWTLFWDKKEILKAAIALRNKCEENKK